jgi:sporulation protein YlmC with PRC-barrel domain
MAVVATDGSSLGKVKDIIFDRQGRATHIVIAYGALPQTNAAALPNDGVAASSPDGKLTAMPWDAAIASIKNGQLVLDGAVLQAAPSYTPGTRPNLDDPDWNAAADAYWRKAVQEAIEAHPGAPIDSPSRSRERPDRDGE